MKKKIDIPKYCKYTILVCVQKMHAMCLIAFTMQLSGY